MVVGSATIGAGGSTPAMPARVAPRADAKTAAGATSPRTGRTSRSSKARTTSAGDASVLTVSANGADPIGRGNGPAPARLLAGAALCGARVRYRAARDRAWRRLASVPGHARRQPWRRRRAAPGRPDRGPRTQAGLRDPASAVTTRSVLAGLQALERALDALDHARGDREDLKADALLLDVHGALLQIHNTRHLRRQGLAQGLLATAERSALLAQQALEPAVSCAICGTAVLGFGCHVFFLRLNADLAWSGEAVAWSLACGLARRSARPV